MTAGNETEQAFQAWLDRYIKVQLEGSIAKHFLTLAHLQDAFMAGWNARAGSGQDADDKEDK